MDKDIWQPGIKFIKIYLEWHTMSLWIRQFALAPMQFLGCFERYTGGLRLRHRWDQVSGARNKTHPNLVFTMSSGNSCGLFRCLFFWTRSDRRRPSSLFVVTVSLGLHTIVNSGGVNSGRRRWKPDTMKQPGLDGMGIKSTKWRRLKACALGLLYILLEGALWWHHDEPDAKSF